MSEIGPMMPPSMRRKSQDGSDEEKSIGPQIPGSRSKQTDSDDDMTIGPAMPPSLPSQSRTIGPTMPSQGSDSSDDDYCPQLPPGLPVAPPAPVSYQAAEPEEESSSDDEMIGPALDLAAPAGAQYDAAAEFAARNRSLEAEKQRVEDEKLRLAAGREEWMTSLPVIGLAQDIGLTARTFRSKGPAAQDSSWTKAPGDKTKNEGGDRPPVSNKRRYEDEKQSRKDTEIAEKLTKFNGENRKVSLVEMHEKKMKKEKKKKKKETGDKTERVPFSRESDLQVNKFDEAQRKSILKKAAQLDNRFGHGSQKYE